MTPGDFRSPRVEPIPDDWSFDRFLADYYTSGGVMCEHLGFTALRQYLGGPLEDHDTTDGQCQTCGSLLICTSYANGRVEYDAMPTPYAKERGYLAKVLA